MNMNGEQRIAAPRQRVWEALNDPEILRASIPGCQSLAKESDTRFTATVEVKVGPIGARFKGAVNLEDINPPHGYTLMLEGSGGIAGSMKGAAKVQLKEEAGGTLLTYDVDAQVGGRMAQLGGPIIDATAKQLAGKFFATFGKILSGEMPSGAEQSAPAAAAKTAASSAQRSGSTAPAAGMPLAWILATVVAALVGFMIGRSQGAFGSDWLGIAVGLLLIVVAAAAFEQGRRSSSTVVVLDNASLRRLLDGARE